MATAGPVTGVTPSGEVAGQYIGYSVDARRMNRVLARIVRGLYFHEYHRTVPFEAVVRTRFEPFADADRDPVRDNIQRRGKNAAAGAFQYWLGSAEDEPRVTICQMQFFGGVIAQGTIEA